MTDQAREAGNGGNAEAGASAGAKRDSEASTKPREEAVESRADEEAAEDVEQDLDELLANVKRERDEYLKLAQGAKADFENYRKRVARDIGNAEARGVGQIVRELLPVLDNLERALAAAEPRDRDQPESHLSEGVRLVYEELNGVLKRAGVESIEADGEAFDPNWHEAVSTRSEDGAAPGTVLEVLQKGYKREGSVLRPARVVVAQEPEGEEADGAKE